MDVNFDTYHPKIAVVQVYPLMATALPDDRSELPWLHVVDPHIRQAVLMLWLILVYDCCIVLAFLHVLYTSDLYLFSIEVRLVFIC